MLKDAVAPNPLCDAVIKSIHAMWDAKQPAAIQIGCGRPKDYIIKKLLEDSRIQFPLLVTPTVTEAYTKYKDIAFFTAVPPNEFVSILEETDPAKITQYDIVIMEEPWVWASPRKSEGLFKRAAESEERLLAIGVWHQSNTWSFDAMIPKYATWELDPHFDKTALTGGIDFKGNTSLLDYRNQLLFGRNLLINGEPHAL